MLKKYLEDVFHDHKAVFLFQTDFNAEQIEGKATHTHTQRKGRSLFSLLQIG